MFLCYSVQPRTDEFIWVHYVTILSRVLSKKRSLCLEDHIAGQLRDQIENPNFRFSGARDL